MRFFLYLLFVSFLLACHQRDKDVMSTKKNNIHKNTTTLVIQPQTVSTLSVTLSDTFHKEYNTLLSESKLGYMDKTLCASLVFEEHSSLFLEVELEDLELPKNYSLKDQTSKVILVYKNELYIALQGNIFITQLNRTHGNISFKTTCKLKNIKSLDKEKEIGITFDAVFRGENLRTEDI